MNDNHSAGAETWLTTPEACEYVGNAVLGRAIKRPTLSKYIGLHPLPAGSVRRVRYAGQAGKPASQYKRSALDALIAELNTPTVVEG